MKKVKQERRRSNSRQKRRLREHKRSMLVVSAVIILLGAIVFVNSMTLRAKEKAYQEQEIELKQQIEEEHQKTKEIDKLEEYVGTDAYIEDMAREKLGMVYKDEIIFMKKVTEGAAKSSYGIYAAKIAGAPNKVIKRASEILKKLETEAGVQAENIELNTQKSVGMLPFYDDKKIKETIIKERESEIEKEIKELNISIITPIDAINLINKWKNMI